MHTGNFKAWEEFRTYRFTMFRSIYHFKVVVRRRVIYFRWLWPNISCVPFSMSFKSDIDSNYCLQGSVTRATVVTISLLSCCCEKIAEVTQMQA